MPSVAGLRSPSAIASEGSKAQGQTREGRTWPWCTQTSPIGAEDDRVAQKSCNHAIMQPQRGGLHPEVMQPCNPKKHD
eukprot:1277657-Amphidinium_carterae.2